MSRPSRLVAVAAAVLLAGGAAAGQVPTAPPPHPTLDDLVREYRRLGLPEPPPGAELVRIGWSGGNPGRLSLLAFKVPATGPNRRPRYWVGGQIWDRAQPPGHWEDPVGPGAEAARGLAPSDADKRLLLAVQCQAHGWPELARAVYELALAELRERAEALEQAVETPIEVLRETAWYYWELERLNEPGADRREPLRRLRSIVAEDTRFRTAENRELLDDLEFTIKCQPARPGTVEALIDSLTEYEGVPDLTFDLQPPHAGYVKLTELGFDAVPALLDHLNDPRVTRWHVYLGNLAVPFRARVGYVAAELLGHLAGFQEQQSWHLPGVKFDTEKARRWWAAAQAVGEEKWLLDHVAWPQPVEGWVGLNEHVLRVIRVKYPARLPEVYRAHLRRAERTDSAACVNEIRASILPRGQQIALFEEGARHAVGRHRFCALGGLGRIDPTLIRERVLRLARNLAGDPEGAGPGALAPGDVAALVELAGDRACWEALAAAATKLKVEDRRELIWQLSRQPEHGRPDPHRRERLRILVSYLGDQSVIEVHDDTVVLTSCVGDHAADRLARLLGLRPWDDEGLEFDTIHVRGPLTRLILRFAVWRAAERELRRLGG